MSKYIDAETMIKAMPPIMEWLSKRAQSIDIVRCSECKHSRGVLEYCANDHWVGKDDDFCSYGERREP